MKSRLVFVAICLPFAVACSSANKGADDGTDSTSSKISGDPGADCKPTSCPPVQKPICADGSIPEVVNDDQGCPSSFRCVTEPPPACPPVMAPPDMCNGGQMIEEKDKSGCTVGFHCPQPQGASVWTSDATKFVAVDEGGGLAPAGPKGSQCPMGAATYTFERATSVLTWSYCDSSNFSSPWLLRAGQRSLAPSEAQQLNDAAASIKLSNGNGCGADKSVRTIAIATPTGDHLYLDSFNACQQQGTYVDGIDAPFEIARSLAK